MPTQDEQQNYDTDTGLDSPEDNAEEVRTISFLTPRISSRLEALAEDIEKDLNIRTEFEILDEATMQMRIATRNLSDIYYNQTGALMHSINPEVNAVDLTGEEFADLLAEPFRKVASINSRLYAVPVMFSANAYIWLYNKQIYNDLELDPPETWDEFMENCQTIAEAGFIPITAPYQDNWRAQLILLADAYNILSVQPDFPARLTTNQMKYATTPIALRSFEKLAGAGRFFDGDYLSITSGESMRRLLDGEAAHFFHSFRSLDDSLDDGTPVTDVIGYFTQPGDDADDAGVTVWLPDGYFIYKNSPNIELAKEWFAYYLSRERLESANLGNTQLVLNLDNDHDNSKSGNLLAEFIRDKRYALAIEFLSPLKGLDSPSISLDVISGLFDPFTGAMAFDNDLEKQAIQLGLPGW